MSNKKPSTKQKTTTATSGAKRPAGRPKKSPQPSSKRKIAEYNAVAGAKPRQDKARIIAITDESKTTPVTAAVKEQRVPKSVKKLTTAKVKSFKIDGAVLGKTKTEPSNQDIMKSLEGLKRSLVTEAKAVHDRFDSLNAKVDVGIEIFTEIKRDLNKPASKRSIWPWRNH